jgi:hypothetical protein
MTDEDLSLKNPLELPIRFSKKNYYDYENLWYKMPFFVEKKGSTGLTLIKKALKFLYGEAYDDSKKRTKLFGGKSY